MKKILAVLTSLIVVAVVAFLTLLTILEYNPEEIEGLEVMGNANDMFLSIDEEYSVTSFNIGYGGLSETEDFFMDGGEKVRPDSKELVENNIENIKAKIVDIDSEFYIIQEIDEDSKRSYNINQIDELLLEDMEGSFAYNYKATYVPFPLPTIGKVNSGILTMGRFNIVSSDRVSLPNPFSWPVRTVNLKRAMQITRYEIEDNENEFVLINFHLEAFDNGEGKTEQTKLLSEIILNEYEKGNYVIAGGDWNQTLIRNFEMDSNLLTEWTPGTLDWDNIPNWEIGVDKDIPSNRSMLMPYVGNEDVLMEFYIDGFIVSPNVEIIETKVQKMDYKYSDHEPVKMVFKLTK